MKNYSKKSEIVLYFGEKGKNMTEEKRRTFSLTEIERARADAWLGEHMKICRFATPAEQEKAQHLAVMGGFINYIFTQNSAFNGVSIRCKCTNEEIDITDYESI